MPRVCVGLGGWKWVAGAGRCMGAGRAPCRAGKVGTVRRCRVGLMKCGLCTEAARKFA